MNWVIRKVKTEDLEAVVEIELICFPKEEAASKNSLRQRIQYIADGFFVAEMDSIIIGFINGCITNSMVIVDELYLDGSRHTPDGLYQAVFGLDVLPDYQHMGVGSSLMRYYIAFARECGRKGIILTCKKCKIPFYSNLGFCDRGVSNSTHGGAIWYNMLLIL